MSRRLAFDIELMRPGCVLLQATMGGDSELAHEFDTQDWLLAPTPGLKLYPVEDWQIPYLVQKVRDAASQHASSARVAG